MGNVYRVLARKNHELSPWKAQSTDLPSGVLGAHSDNDNSLILLQKPQWLPVNKV